MPTQATHPTPQNTLHRLVAYIRQHNQRAWISSIDGRLRAIEDFTVNGVPGSRTVELAPTWTAVREWLGY